MARERLGRVDVRATASGKASVEKGELISSTEEVLAWIGGNQRGILPMRRCSGIDIHEIAEFDIRHQAEHLIQLLDTFLLSNAFDPPVGRFAPEDREQATEFGLNGFLRRFVRPILVQDAPQYPIVNLESARTLTSSPGYAPSPTI